LLLYQSIEIACIARAIGFELGIPTTLIRLGLGLEAASMSMPEAALNQDDLAMPREHDVRLARQIFAAANPEPVAKLVQ